MKKKVINGWFRLSHARDSGEEDPQCRDIGPFSEFWVESQGNATEHSIFPSADRAARFTSLRQMATSRRAPWLFCLL